MIVFSMAAVMFLFPMFSGNPREGEAVVKEEFIFLEAPFAQCHASTIEETKGGLIAAWFGGTREKHWDVGIWVARLEGGKWTSPEEVADGVQHEGGRFPCWNPVLFQWPDGPLMLFYKVGPDPRTWWGMVKTSDDGGRTWSDSRRLPQGILGPVKNKPILLPEGDLLCPSSTEDKGWRIHFEQYSESDKAWRSTGPVNDGKEFGAIQPTLLRHPDGSLQALCRTTVGRIVGTSSSDNGKSWSRMRSIPLPNPNSGIDGTTLVDGRRLLVYNHTTHGRSPLNIAVSDDGKTWKAGLVLEGDRGEYSYPAVIQTRDGLVHITYTWKRRRIKHVMVDPAGLNATPFKEGRWPGGRDEKKK